MNILDGNDNLKCGKEKEESYNALTYLKLDMLDIEKKIYKKRTLEAYKIAQYISENYKDDLSSISILFRTFSNIDIYLNALS